MNAKITTRQLRRLLAATRGSRHSDARERLLVDHRSDPVDEAQWSEDAAVAIEELDVARGNQREASLALDRLQDGSYGICIDCSREIGNGRLQAIPWATRCVRCATLREYARRKIDIGGARPVRDWFDGTPDAA